MSLALLLLGYGVSFLINTIGIGDLLLAEYGVRRVLYVSMRDLMTKVLIDQDMSASEELTTVTTDVTTSAEALTTLCAV